MLYCRACRIGYEAVIQACPRCGRQLVVRKPDPVAEDVVPEGTEGVA
jgi:hypothetical protein